MREGVNHFPQILDIVALPDFDVNFGERIDECHVGIIVRKALLAYTNLPDEVKKFILQVATCPLTGRTALPDHLDQLIVIHV